MGDGLLENSIILFEIICVITVFAIFLIRSHYFTEILEHHPRITTQIILMVFYGLISIVGTVTGIGLFGSIGNVRDIGPMIAGLTCGPVIGVGAGIIGGIFRFIQGGPYMYTGLSAPIFCGILGGLLYLINDREFVPTWIATLYMALCDTFVSIVTLTLVTPPDQLWTITERIAIPMIVGSTVGVFIFAFFIHAQIAERKRDREYKLLERENADKKNLDAIINTIADPVFIFDHNFCWTLVNKKFCQLIGKSREYIIGKPIADSFTREEYETIRDQGVEVFVSRRPIEREMAITGTNGHMITVISKITLYIDSNGHESVVGIFQDISERKEMEKTIRESEACLTSILHGSPMMQFVIDHNHRVISWNKAIEQFTGKTAQDMIGTTDHWKPFYHAKRPMLADILVDEAISSLPQWFDDKLQKAMHVEGAYEGTEYMPDMGLSGRWIYYTAAPVRNSSGSIIGAVETLEDITERKQVESSLKLTLQKLNLLSSITRHDILNKITILSGSLYLVIEFVTEPEGIEHLKRAKKTVDIIKRQIAFTREYQDIGINAPTWQKISEVMHSAVQEMVGGSIRFEVTTTPIEIYADPLLIKVFHNLFENARQHGETVSLVTASDSISDNLLIITVEDNGVGVSNEDKPFIFKRGFGKNTGFGLFLSSEILAITGITIREIGNPETGAVFEIIIPEGGYRTIKQENQK